MIRAHGQQCTILWFIHIFIVFLHCCKQTTELLTVENVGFSIFVGFAMTPNLEIDDLDLVNIVKFDGQFAEIGPVVHKVQFILQQLHIIFFIVEEEKEGQLGDKLDINY